MSRQKTKKRSNRKKCGGENTSPNSRAARIIQSRFRGNKGRKYAATRKELKNLRDNDVFNMINMYYKNMTGKDLSGRGKKKKSKKLTNKKRKSRSKRGGWVLNTGGKSSKKYNSKQKVKRGEWSIIKRLGKMFGGWPGSIFI